MCVCVCVASFPGSRAWEEEREPDTHCSRMRQVPAYYSATLKLRSILFTWRKAALHGYTPSETHTGGF